MEAAISIITLGLKTKKKKSAIRKQGKEKYDIGNLCISDRFAGSAVSSAL
jgi:hypothetical protein